MSKSANNVVGIGDALEKHTSRQIRLLCLLHLWSTTLDYNQNEIDEAENYEETIANFFRDVNKGLC